jgi:hypothetical protein
MADSHRKATQITKVNKNLSKLVTLGSFKVEKVYGVDFSGANQAGKNCWVAECHLGKNGLLECVSLKSLEEYCGSSDRDQALAKLVELVRGSAHSIWGFDFPFAFPAGVLTETSWPSQFAFLKPFENDAKKCGLEFIKLAKQHSEKRIRRCTEIESRTPFDSYHYHIIYQTFFGMRLLLDPIHDDKTTAILPFQYPKLKDAERILVETCPSSFLKKHRLPFQKYKQTTGKTLASTQRDTRKIIFKGIDEYVRLSDDVAKICMHNLGGDALDAVLSAIATWQSIPSADHAAIAKHQRYPLEGYVFA